MRVTVIPSAARDLHLHAIAMAVFLFGGSLAPECPPIPSGTANTQEAFRSWCASVSGRVEQIATGQWKCVCDARTAAASSANVLLGAYDLGASIHNALEAAERRAKARKAAEEAARLERIRLDSIETARRREAAWAKLSGEFRFSTTARLDMRLDSAKSELAFRFDRDTARPELSNRELMARDKTNCFFMGCREKYEMPDEQWTTPYVDLRHLARAAHLVRRTLYAPGDERESLIDQAIEVAQGGRAEIEIPTDGVVLPENALDRMVTVSVDRKVATNERLRAAAVLDSLQQRREFVAGLGDAVRSDARARDRAAALDRLAREQALVDAALAVARRTLEAASRAEEDAIRAERSRLVGTTLRNAAPGRPVENCVDERQAIASIRAGLPRMDVTIAQMDASATRHRADARATIARAKDTGAAAKEIVLDPLNDALKAYRATMSVHAQRTALIMALSPSGAVGADRYRRAANDVWERIDKLKSGAELAQTRLAKANAEAQAIASSPANENPLDILQRMDNAGLLSVLAGQLAAHPAVQARALGPWVLLGEAFIRTASLTADAVIDDRTAQAMRMYANRMREQRQHLASLADEREARLLEIERAGGCLSSPESAP